jgi:hypothetical protein
MDAPSSDDGGIADGGSTDGGPQDGGGSDASGADGGTDGGPPPPPPQVLAAGCEHTCAIATDGSVFCWGRNDYGQLGDGSTMDSATPVAVPALSGAVTVTAGCGHTCAALEDGSVRCWGRNDMAALGIGTLVDSPTPADVAGLMGAAALGAGYHTCARFPDGSLRCAGWNLYGHDDPPNAGRCRRGVLRALGSDGAHDRLLAQLRRAERRPPAVLGQQLRGPARRWDDRQSPDARPGDGPRRCDRARGR